MFWSSTYLGRSLRRFPDSLRPPVRVVCGNSGSGARGLSEIFNQALDSANPATDLVFLHDDVYLHDWFLVAQLALALERFDVVGVAGSANPDLTQPSWGLQFDSELNPVGWQPGLRRSGAVNHFDYGCPDVTVYGPSPLPCALLDGVFLAARTSLLQQRGVRFDNRFKFHCYDLDFCRSALQQQLRLGTWPIALTHDSGGNYASSTFKDSARLYLAKWQGAELSGPKSHEPRASGAPAPHSEPIDPDAPQQVSAARSN